MPRQIAQTRRAADELSVTPGPLAYYPSSPSQHMALNTLPDDLRPAWLSAARETAAVVGPLWETAST